METIIDVRISSIEESSNLDKTKIEDIISNLKSQTKSLIEVAKERNFWDDSIEKIVFTNDYKTDIEEQAKSWNIPVALTKEKEYTGVAKTLFNYNHSDPKRHLFFSFSIFHMTTNFSHIVLGQLIHVYSENICNDELIKYNSYKVNLVTIQDYIKHSLVAWLPKYFAKEIETKVFKNYTNELDADKVFNGFCRKLKRNLFEYNSDQGDNSFRINRFWDKTHMSFTSLISRFIEIKVINGELYLKNEKFLDLFNRILDDIEIIKKNQLENRETLSITLIQKSIIKLFKEFQINLSEAKESIHIKLTKNPKDYFTETLVDTEPRFVCFIDILGFSDMIDEYDEDDTSTVLQDIQLAFSEALKTIENSSNTINKEDIKHLKYQLFSDCVSISIPYFDRQDDFLSNFNLISSFIRGFQLVMMSMGFFTRGGLSIGSYYSDNNIIFSKGLVNAYLLESKKAIYPRVIVDTKVLEKIKKYSDDNIFHHGINNYLVVDWENSVFLNPFNLTTGIVSQFENVINEAKLDNDDFSEGINSLLDMSFNLLKDSLQQVEDSEPQLMETVKEHIDFQKQKNIKVESIVSKYIWIEELIKWIENENSSNLKFKYLYK